MGVERQSHTIDIFWINSKSFDCNLSLAASDEPFKVSDNIIVKGVNFIKSFIPDIFASSINNFNKFGYLALFLTSLIIFQEILQKVNIFSCLMVMNSI